MVSMHVVSNGKIVEVCEVKLSTDVTSTLRKVWLYTRTCLIPQTVQCTMLKSVIMPTIPLGQHQAHCVLSVSCTSVIHGRISWAEMRVQNFVPSCGPFPSRGCWNLQWERTQNFGLMFGFFNDNHCGGTCRQLMTQVGGGKTGNRLRWSIPL